MGGGLAAIEQPGPGQHEGTGADRGDARATCVGTDQCIEQCLRWALAGFAPTGDDDDVGVINRAEIVGKLHLRIAEHAQRTGFARAQLGAVPGHAEFRPHRREQADRAAEFEQPLAVAGDDGNERRGGIGGWAGHGLMLRVAVRGVA